MDLNLYNVHFVVGLFGEPMLVSYHPNLYRNGIDTSGILLLEYPDFICQCTGAKDCAAPGSVQLIGDAGRILIEPGSSNCQKLRLVRPGPGRSLQRVQRVAVVLRGGGDRHDPGPQGL